MSDNEAEVNDEPQAEQVEEEKDEEININTAIKNVLKKSLFHDGESMKK
jgi:hypothetical protein